MFDKLKEFSKAVEVIKKSDNEYQLLSKAMFENRQPFEIYLLKNDKGQLILTDKKATFKFMDKFYNMQSHDVKSSIENVLGLYGFVEFKNAIICRLKEGDDLLEKYFTFVVCIGQLANMFAFFDDPE